MRSTLFLILFFVFRTCFAQTNTDNIFSYTIKNGLSSNAINKILKDSRGFLWIATNEGLNRFDGTHFLSFFNDGNDKKTINGNTVFDILEYKPGHLLIATDNGLSVLNTLTNSFENEKISIPQVYVRSLFKDKQNRIYINYMGEIDVFTNDLKFLYRLTNTWWCKSLKGILIDCENWVQDNKGRIWLPSDNFGICLIDEKNQQAYSWKNNPMHYSFFRKTPVRSFFYDEAKEQIWYSTWGYGLEKYDIKTGKSKFQYFNIAYAGEARTINTIVKKDNRLICYGGQGIYNVDPITMKFEKLYSTKREVAAPFINCHTAFDDSENTWIGTETKGLLQIPHQVSVIREIPLPYSITDYTNYCTGLIVADSTLYLAYGADGLVEVDQRNFKAQRYNAPVADGKSQLVYRVSIDGKNNILVGTTAGVFVFDKQTKKYKRPDWLPPFLQKLNVQCIFPDTKKNIWFSFSEPNSLGNYDAATKHFNYYKNYVVNDKKVFDDRCSINRMIEDEKGNTWMTSYQKGGIACHEFSSDQWKLYPKTSKASQLLSNKEINNICITGNIMWLCNTYGLGLVRYDYTNDSIHQILRKDGLLSGNVLAISKDQKNNLFLSTKAGINYFVTQTKEIRPLVVNDGNIDWGFAYTQFYDTTNNQLIYGLNDRILIIKIKLWEDQSAQLNTFINRVEAGNISYPLTNNLSIDPFNKNISIDFTSINYNKNLSAIYGYKMKGIDKDWNTTPATTANYSNLSPGHYTFMVKAKSQSGEWGPVNQSLHITILPALWQRTWFWILTIAAISLTLFWLIRKRINAIKKSAGLKQKLMESEMLALRSQMNPHFIFNCLNAIDNLIQINEPDKATTYLARFAKLIRSVLESSKINLVPFYKDYEALQLFLQLEQFRCSNKFIYELEADEELLQGDYKVPPLIVQPFVENAIHHGLLNKETGEKKMKVKASLQGSFIKYTITDNGVGRVKANEIKKMNRPEHVSYGIQITTERIALHNHNSIMNRKTQVIENEILISDLSENGVIMGTQVDMFIKIDH